MEFLLQTLLRHALSTFLIIGALNIENPQETASVEMELSAVNRTLQVSRQDLNSAVTHGERPV